MKQVIKILEKRRETILYSLKWHKKYNPESYQSSRQFVMDEVAEIDQALSILGGH